MTGSIVGGQLQPPRPCTLQSVRDPVGTARRPMNGAGGPQVAADLFESVSFVRLDDGWSPSRPGRRFTNPSIHPAAEPPCAAVRLVNYRLSSGRYAVADPDRVVRTEIYRADLDACLRTRCTAPVADRADTPAPEFPVHGFEDARLFSHGGHEYAIATVRSWNAAGVAQQCLVRFQGGEIAVAQALSHSGDGYQKNWMPVVGAAAMTFVDRCAPLRLRVVDPDLGTVRCVEHVDADEPAARGYRGGSQLIRCGDGWLAVVHEVSVRVAGHHDDHDRGREGGRTYLHRFVAFDDGLRPRAASGAFSFVGSPVEFCAGLRRHGDDLVASFGVDDAEAWLARIPVDEVLTALVPYAVEERVEERFEQRIEDRLSSAAEAPPRTGIVSVTLAHHGREEALAAAMASVVDWADHCLVVDTSGSPSIHAVAAAAVGDRLVPAEWPWSGDFGAARSAALALAASRTDAAWAVIVDSDEVIDVDPTECAEGLGAVIAGLPSDVHSFTTWDRHGLYTKIRGIRLPVSGRYVGATHEYFDPAGHRQVLLPGVRFWEQPKSSAEVAAKSDRDVAVLRRVTVQRPRDGRWWYYLGDALANRGDRSDAIDAFRRCAEVETWPEQAAWACYREAQLWVDAGDYDTAVDRCMAGLARHPGVAELAWYAGYAAYQGGRHRDAAAFANLAIVHGEYVGVTAARDRILFRHVPALYEGPFDILRHAYRALGDRDAAERAEADHRAASAARQARRVT